MATLNNLTCQNLTYSIKTLSNLKDDFDVEIGQDKPTLAQIREIKSQIEVEICRYSLEIAERIMQEDFLGPDAIKTAFGPEVVPDKIPPVPFSITELKRAKALGQFLVLRSDKGREEGKEILRFTRALYIKMPETKWALVSKYGVPGSFDKNYWQQTRTMVSYLKNEVFPGGLPKGFKEAVDEFKKYEKHNFGGKTDDEINDIMIAGGTEKYSMELSSLKINKLARHNEIELVYDLELYRVIRDEYLLTNTWGWTSKDHLDFIGCMGKFIPNGLEFSSDAPYYHSPDLCVLFSRTC